MTMKCCRDCVNLSTDTRQCNFLKFWFPDKKSGTRRAKDLNQDTFYCAAFQPRRNSAKKVGGEEEVKQALPTPEDVNRNRAKWTLCSCRHIAQEHDKDGKCEECKCQQYTGKIVWLPIPAIQRRFV